MSQLQPLVDKLKAGGVTLGNLMIGGFPNTIYGQPGRDEEIEKVRQSIEAAGKVGLPVVEYNFYAHRAMEGYYEETGRGGAGLTGADYDRMKDLPPLPEEGAHTLDEMWANITYFLKAVIPVAEKANVRLALHPNDPPFPMSRGSQQIMATVAGWKHLIEIVDSPANGITFDCGVTKEMGEDPVEVCRYFGSRDRINHMHYRNPARDEALRKIRRRFHRRGRREHVRGDAGTDQGEVHARDLSGTSPRAWTMTARAGRFTAIPAAAATPATFTTLPMPRRCCRRR